MRIVDRLSEPQNLRKLLLALVALVILALALATVAIIRELHTASNVRGVTTRVTNVERPSRAQLERAVDRTIRDLTLAQRRELLTRLLRAATKSQRALLRRYLRDNGLPPRSVYRPPAPRVVPSPRAGPLRPLLTPPPPARPPAPPVPPPAVAPAAPPLAAPSAPAIVPPAATGPGNAHRNRPDPQPGRGRDGG